MSLALKPMNLGVEWIGEPDLAFAGNLTHTDPKVGIPAAGPWSRDQPNHPAAVTAGFIGTAESIAKARIWLARAAEGSTTTSTIPSAAPNRTVHLPPDCVRMALKPRSLLPRSVP